MTFAHGQIKQNIEVKVRADTLPELDESFQIQLKSVNQVSLLWFLSYSQCIGIRTYFLKMLDRNQPYVL